MTGVIPFIEKSGDDTAPAVDAKTVTPNDGAALPDGSATALYFGGAGNVKIKTAMDTDITFIGLTAGAILPVRVKQVFSTGTTATNIIALY